MEEERRLLYVGITRARERVLITHTRYRFAYGQMTDQRPSRFTQEIPTHLAIPADVAHWSQSQLQRYFADWLDEKEIKVEKVVYEAPKSAPSELWKQGQIVSHATFGQGVIERVEKKGTSTWHLTIRFKSGIKKLDSGFLS